ncbi:MAG: acyl carrier protein [Oscillospiraceae bacterium]|nr:acyl carrier protein [Oscillospiraceae bacterium]
MYEKIIDILVRQLQVDKSKVTEDTHIMDDLGADSIDVVEILMAIEEAFGVTVPDEDIMNMRTPADIRAYVIAKTGEEE